MADKLTALLGTALVTILIMAIVFRVPQLRQIVTGTA